MIHISDIAKKIEKFLLKEGESKFKILIRINFRIDVYVATENCVKADNYQQEFWNSQLVSDAADTDEYYCKLKDTLKIKFIVVDRSEADNDSFYDNVFSGSDEHIDWGPRYRFDSLLEQKEKQEHSLGVPVVTFYSYKGGMGRTTTMIAYALSLAANAENSKRKKVVVIDCDLEAPGYLNFFDLSKHEELNSGKKNGLVEFICDAQFTRTPEELELDDYIINVGRGNKNNFAYQNLDNIWLVPAGNLNEDLTDDILFHSNRKDYLEGLAKLNLASVPSVVESLNLLFRKIEKTIQPDVILIDSRTGFNDIFGTAALYLSSSVVGFFGFSRQTQPGLMNLLREYYKKSNNFSLDLVFSILPEKAEENWIQKHEQEILNYIKDIGNEDKSQPAFFYLHRNSLMESIGMGDEKSDAEFVKLVNNKGFEDYVSLFEAMNKRVLKKEEAHIIPENIEENNPSKINIQENDETTFSVNTPALPLRNVVLKHLKDVLRGVKNFAEDTQIDESQFFYRKCMKELFEQKKFIIRGYKGTGKTYLYKALADSKISANIQKWAGKDGEGVLSPVFVNILPTNDTALVFDSIKYTGIEEPEHYFDVFWQIYTWNALLLLDEFKSIKEDSKLKEYVLPLQGSYAKEALLRINELIDKIDNLDDTSIAIEKDILRLNEYLKTHNQKLFVLYDRLDTCINPLRWDKAVSPLINYWRSNYETFSNISPKIFVRTDLFRQINGTNTARLENNIINIEWSIGEVFGFFFKLIFSDKRASNAFWTIARKAHTNEAYIKTKKDSFENNFPYNQFKDLSRADMLPVVRIFFGDKVTPYPNRDTNLGRPWEYFEKELSNADNTAISLRPFINTLDSNAVDKALARTEKYIRNGIISPEIYASKAVRDKTTETYFNDLTQDAFSKDLVTFKDVIRTTVGEPYRYKALTESQFEELINITFERIEKIHDSEVVKQPIDLKNLIFANGIMAKKVTTKGTYYRFAPIYWYSWGLVNSDLENKEREKRKSDKNHSLTNQDNDVREGTFHEGHAERMPYVTALNDGEQNKYEARNAPKELIDGDTVIFKVGKEPHKYRPNQTFYFAYDIEIKDNIE